MRSSRSAAYLLVEALVAKGLDMFFGIPGGPICPVFDAIRTVPGARLISSRHESSAAFAAALYHRASGKVPVVVVTAGPGATNVVTGIASAYLERIPLLLIVGDVAWATSGGKLAQDSGLEGLNIEMVLGPITRAQVRASHSRSVVFQAMTAIEVAMNPAFPGPALFVLPLDHAMGESAPFEVSLSGYQEAAMPRPEDVDRTATLLRDAEHPLIVIGAGCRGHEGSLVSMVEALDVPFVTTPAAKGFIDEMHPNSLRNGGLAASQWAIDYTSSPVDVCLVLGTDLDDSTIGSTPYCSPEGTLIHVDLNPAVFGRNLTTKLGIVSDVGAFSRVLFQVAQRHLVGAAELLKDVKATSPFGDNGMSHLGPDKMHPAWLLSDLQNSLPHSRFVTDIGEHMLFALHYLTADPGSFFIQLSLGSMGSGIAGSIGLALADSSLPIVCISGDGGMHMYGMEILVAVQEMLPILFVVFNDGKYNMVHHGMRQIFGEASQYDNPPVDFSAWASSLGVPSLIITRAGDITHDLVKELMSHGGPALIDARIDSDMHMSGGGRIAALQRMSMGTHRV